VAVAGAAAAVVGAADDDVAGWLLLREHAAAASDTTASTAHHLDVLMAPPLRETIPPWPAVSLSGGWPAGSGTRHGAAAARGSKRQRHCATPA
jgi:hypothetical protein